MAKIQETARKLNVKVEFVKTDKDMTEKLHQNGEEKPSLIIFDLNNKERETVDPDPQTQEQIEKGNFDHRVLVARSRGSQAEGARSGMRHGIAALSLLPEFATAAATPRSPGRRRANRTLTDFCVRRTALVRHIRTHDQETRSTVVGDSLLLSLARRPSERTPAEQVDVQMKYGLSRTRADVEYRSVALFDISLACDLCCG